LQGDMLELDLEPALKEFGFKPPFDVVISDMAPKTTGVRITDQARSLELCEKALETAEKYLKPGGHFVAKLFHSNEFETFRNQLRSKFGKVDVIKPKSTRKESKEIFLIGIRYRCGSPQEG